MQAKDLNPADYNPRKISTEDFLKLRKAIIELGDLSGIIPNRRTGNLIGGHQRIKIAPRDAEIHITDRYDPPTEKGTTAEGYIVIAGEKHKYREVDWPLEKEKIANLAANNQGGENDNTKLAEILSELSCIPNLDLSLTGIDSGELDKLIDGLTGIESKVKEWDLTETEIPFWAVVRCPIDKADQVKAALAGLGDDVIVESSL